LLAVSLAPAALADDWPQWLGPQRDGVWRETGIFAKFPTNGPPIRWRTPIAAGYAGPAVAGGRVCVTDRIAAPRRAGSSSGGSRGSIPGTERVLCLNEADGKILWQHEYDCAYNVDYPAGPRATPTVHDGHVFTLGTEGSLFCFEAASGKIAWSRELKKDYNVETPVWGFAGHPLVDGDKLICLVGGEGSVAVAFDRNTGKELWRALSAREPGYCPPMIYEAGGRRQLILWHPESLNSLDPETGKVYWTIKYAARSGLAISTPRPRGDRLFITSFYNGPLMVRLHADKPEATELWRGSSSSERNTDGLHSIISTPFFDEGHIYGVCSYGQLRCLRAETGARLWETLAATTGREARWANAFLIKHGDRFFLANEKGELIIARLTPQGYEEISRAQLLQPTNTAGGRDVVWSHPAFANRCVYARNDKEIVCISLVEEEAGSVGGVE
jgi:outer membrane protein assembly factor BamB